jgi:hypothetical protein
VWGQADSASLQVYEQNDRLVQHIAKQHADELQVAAQAADPKAIHARFCRLILPPSHDCASPPLPPHLAPRPFQAARVAAAALLENSNSSLKVRLGSSASAPVPAAPSLPVSLPARPTLTRRAVPFDSTLSPLLLPRTSTPSGLQPTK